MVHNVCDFKGPIFCNLAASPQLLIVDQQSWSQNAQNSQFPTSDLEKTFVYLLQKKSYFKKTKFFHPKAKF